uniref:Uncharacterized protein n=1 Tax=Anguilla anguilla TaxID=7936 RepID=A0A0E9Q6G7_ANGAN
MFFPVFGGGDPMIRYAIGWRAPGNLHKLLLFAVDAGIEITYASGG